MRVAKQTLRLKVNTAQKMKFFITEFFSKCDQIRSFLRIWSHLLKKSLMKNFIFLCSERYKIQAFTQIIFHNVNIEGKRTRLNTTDSHAIYEKCKSRELLTSFNRICLCMRYQQAREDRINLKYVIVASQTSHAPVSLFFIQI